MINHNQMNDVKQLSIREIYLWKKSLKIRLKSNFSEIIQEELYNELNPNIKKKLLDCLLEEERKFFFYLFSNY